MSTKTKIEWCDSTVNFWSGCTKVSTGCDHCYAEVLSNRFANTPRAGLAIGKWGPGATRKLHESAFKMAHQLNRKPWVCDACGEAFADGAAHSCCLTGATVHRRRIFSLSLGDWLDPEVPAEWLARMLDTIRECTEVRWLLLTKRPELWLERMTVAIGNDLRNESHGKEFNDWLSAWTRGHAPSHVWLGTSVKDQDSAAARIPALLRIPAAGRFLSCEPLLGAIDLERVRWKTQCDHHRNKQPDHFENVLIGGGPVQVPKVDWVIVGGESGPKARPCNVEWIRSLVRQGKDSGVPVFVKQLGSNRVLTSGNGLCTAHPTLSVIRDRKGSDPSEWPEDLRVREFPEGLR